MPSAMPRLSGENYVYRGGGWSGANKKGCVRGAVLKRPEIFLLRTAPRDHQPPTANRHQPPTAANCQLPATTNHGVLRGLIVATKGSLRPSARGSTAP